MKKIYDEEITYTLWRTPKEKPEKEKYPAGLLVYLCVLLLIVFIPVSYVAYLVWRMIL